MDPITLQLWSVIGTWLAGVGTLGAVITSLWFAFNQNRIKLKVTAGHRIFITSASTEKPDYCFIKVVNVGLRPAKISNVSWQVGKGKKKKQVLQTFGFPGFDDIPKTIQQGEEAVFMIPFLYTSADKDWIVHFPKYIVGDDSPKLIKSLKVCVYTSVGQSFKTKAEPGLIEKIEKSFEANKNKRLNNS